MSAELRIISYRLGLSQPDAERLRARVSSWGQGAPTPLGRPPTPEPAWLDQVNAPLENLRARKGFSAPFRDDILGLLAEMVVTVRQAEPVDAAPSPGFLLHPAAAAPAAAPPTRAPTRRRAAEALPAPPRPAGKPKPPTLPERFIRPRTLGSGGMGAVFRVYDRRMARDAALKVIHTEYAEDRDVNSRFIHEAQVTAQLQHPGVVPVYDLLRLPDQRPAYLMREVQGESLADRFDTRVQQPLNLSAIVEILRKVCDAVGYAHSRGVIHRDLKPENILIGPHGDVAVIDWGLAKVLDVPGAIKVPRHTTEERIGVNGTPGYMAPEQVRAEEHLQSTATDVYGLGALLYEALTGWPPHEDPADDDEDRLLARVLAQAPTPPVTTTEAEAALARLAFQALSPNPADRPANASVFGELLRDWAEGASRRERALVLLGQAIDKRVAAQRLRSRAEAVQEAGRRALVLNRDRDPRVALTEKQRADADAGRLVQGAEVLETVSAQLAHSALAQDSTLSEALELLANHQADELRRAEAAEDERALSRARLLLSAYDRGRHADLLRAEGAFSLETDPPGCTVDVHRIQVRGGQSLPDPLLTMLHTPVRGHTLPVGSYLLVLRHPERETVRYPIRIERGVHWGEAGSVPADATRVRLPLLGELGEDERLVPGGWCWIGDRWDPTAFEPHRVWVPGFVAREHPVTQEEYLVFIEHLRRTGRAEEALARAPRTPDTLVAAGGLAWRTRPDGAFRLPSAWFGDAPVVLVDHDSAVAYARWHSVQTGKIWRLPHEIEWEKMARGVDARPFPWGPGSAHERAHCQALNPDRPARVHENPSDTSIYGVSGLAGNVRDWCGNAYQPSALVDLDEPYDALIPSGTSQLIAIRGGSWASDPARLAASSRDAARPFDRAEDLGFRLVRSERRR